MEQYHVWKDKYEQSIVPVIGEMSLPKLGLGDETWALLSAEVWNVLAHNKKRTIRVEKSYVYVVFA